jgi:Peptidase M15
MLKNIKSAIHLSQLSSSQIKELQQLLVKLKYGLGNIDGIFGNNTLYAFKRFKEDYKLTNPELFGPTTYSVLITAIDDSLDNKEIDSEIHPKQPIFDKAQSIPNIIDWRDFSCPISKFFTVGEVSKFSTDRIVLNSTHQKNAIQLARLLDQIRLEWGGPIAVTSWYRPPAVNKSVHGAINSQHLTGSGADIYPINSNGKEFEEWLNTRWNRALGYGQRSSKNFSHLDLRPTPSRIRWYY